MSILITDRGVAARTAPHLAMSELPYEYRAAKDERGRPMHSMHRHRFTSLRTLTVVHDAEKARRWATLWAWLWVASWASLSVPLSGMWWGVLWSALAWAVMLETRKEPE